jgi:hypothetical protein
MRVRVLNHRILGSPLGMPLEGAFVAQELWVWRERTVGALTSQVPAELLVEPSASSVPSEDPYPGTLDAPTLHPIEHRVVRGLGEAGAPMLEGDPEVEELIAADRSETRDRVVDQDHVTVDVRRLNLPQPTLRHLHPRERVCVLWKHLREPANGPWLLDVKHVRDICRRHRSQNA